MLTNNFFNNTFVFPILNFLVFLYKGFSFFKIPGAFGFAIIGLTIIIRSLFQPFFKKQLETSKKMAELKPQIDKLTKKYKHDQKKLQEEQLKLYQKAGINPGVGCLMPLLQFPIFIALYKSFSVFLINDNIDKALNEINKVLYWSFLKIKKIDLVFFGFDLSLSPQKSGNIFYFIVPLLTVFLQYLQMKTMNQSLIQKNENKEENKKENEQEDFQKIMNNQMMVIFPLMIGWFSYTLPVGLSLYWNVFSIFGINQGKKLQVDTDKQIPFSGNDN